MIGTRSAIRDRQRPIDASDLPPKGKGCVTGRCGLRLRADPPPARPSRPSRASRDAACHCSRGSLRASTSSAEPCAVERRRRAHVAGGPVCRVRPCREVQFALQSIRTLSRAFPEHAILAPMRAVRTRGTARTDGASIRSTAPPFSCTAFRSSACRLPTSVALPARRAKAGQIALCMPVKAKQRRSRWHLVVHCVNLNT